MAQIYLRYYLLISKGVTVVLPFANCLQRIALVLALPFPCPFLLITCLSNNFYNFSVLQSDQPTKLIDATNKINK
jgi:hypothetical protein